MTSGIEVEILDTTLYNKMLIGYFIFNKKNEFLKRNIDVRLRA